MKPPVAFGTPSGALLWPLEGRTPPRKVVIMGMCLGFVLGASLTSTILGGVIGGVVAAGVLYVISRLAHSVRYRNPIKVWHEPRRGDRLERIDLDDHQHQHQPIRITLTIHQRVHVVLQKRLASRDLDQ